MKFEDLLNIKEDLWSYLARTEKPVVMYGTGNGADKIIDVLNNYGIKLYGIFASDDFARGQIFRGYRVKKYSDFKNELSEFIVLVSFASQRTEVLENIYHIAQHQELYAPDVPVFGDGLFNLEYFNGNLSRLSKVYDTLSDDISKETFVSSLAFKLTGDISYLRMCETAGDEIYSLLSEKISNKNYIDIGAYTGDTVQKYTEYFGNDCRIYAFEPDEKNFKKMLARFDEYNITCKSFNAAAWDKNVLLKFNARSGRAASASLSIGNEKIKKIQGVRVDEAIDDDIGFIKIDAEGSDSKVISGLERIIVRSKPIIKVAAYHRNEDFFEIPETVDGICEEYKLYMRHLPYVPGWDTDFIFEFK